MKEEKHHRFAAKLGEVISLTSNLINNEKNAFLNSVSNKQGVKMRIKIIFFAALFLSIGFQEIIRVSVNISVENRAKYVVNFDNEIARAENADEIKQTTEFIECRESIVCGKQLMDGLSSLSKIKAANDSNSVLNLNVKLIVLILGVF